MQTKQSSSLSSAFINAATSGDAYTWNGAQSNSTTGSKILDYFAKCGTYRNRPQDQVDADMASIFGENPELALKVVFYNRLITRKPNINSVTKVQRGMGNRDEYQKCLDWMRRNRPELLYNNLWLIPNVGCWKDLWYNSPVTKYHSSFDKEMVYYLVQAGIQLKEHRALIAKYLPKIRTGKKYRNGQDRHQYLNDFARGFCKFMKWSEKDYRLFKSSPENTAHLWQRNMSRNEWQDIDFNKISGKALFNLVSKRGKDHKTTIERHNLEEKYIKWIKSKPVAKFSGYVYELYKAAKKQPRSLVQRYTYNAQFEQLLARVKEDINPELLDAGVLCALDTSGSMTWSEIGGYQPIDICVGLGIFFSKLLKGAFQDNVVMFSDESTLLKLTGDFCDRVDQIPSDSMGSTNFQSVIDLIVRVRLQNPNIPVEDYPKVLLIVSDMMFSPAGLNVDTNYNIAMQKLANVGLPKMTIIWWVVNGNGTTDFPSKITDEGTVLVSGFDPSIVTNILGTPDVVDEVTGEKRKPDPYEVMLNALNQEILNLLVTDV